VEHLVFRLEGVLPALVTPFSDDLKNVDAEKLRRLVNFVIEKGVTGVVPCGTTGEMANLTMDEKKRVIKLVVDEVNGRVPVIAGTAWSETGATIEMTKYAKDVGADAAIVVTPYYHKPTNRGLYEHYRLVAESVDLPIVLYNIPQVTGVLLPWQVVEDLVEFSNIVGLKDSSGEIRYILSVLEKVGDRLSVVVGHDEVVIGALAAGCKGMILASANFIPDLWLKLHRLMKEGKVDEARKIQLSIQKIARIIARSGPVGTKAALKCIGVDMGAVRLPLSLGGELSFEDSEEIRLDLEKLGKAPAKARVIEPVEAKKLEERFEQIEIAPQLIRELRLLVGEGLAGEEPEIAHIDVMIGPKDGPVGAAFTKAKATPSKGHEPLLAILEPNLMVKPVTLMIPTVSVKDMRQASMVYGPAQGGVAKAVADSVADGTIPKSFIEDLIVLANVFVHPAAVDRKRVYINNYKAMRHAVRRAVEGRPSLEEILRDREKARHPLKYSP